MAARVFALVVIGWLWLGAVLSAGAASLTHTPPQWQAMGRGLAFTQVDVLKDGLVVEGLDAALRSTRILEGGGMRRKDAHNADAAQGGKRGGFATRGDHPHPQTKRLGGQGREGCSPSEPRTSRREVLGNMADDQVVDRLQRS